MFFALILLLIAPARVELSDEVCQIPAGEWRYREVELHQDPARVSASYEVQSGSGRVRLALMERSDLDRLREDLPHGFIAETPQGHRGQFVDRFHRRGTYEVVLDNREGRQDATVHLRVWADFGVGRASAVTGLSPTRQLTVIFVSVAVFLGIVTYSGRRLWQALKK
jgi:hypothetical protein